MEGKTERPKLLLFVICLQKDQSYYRTSKVTTFCYVPSTVQAYLTSDWCNIVGTKWDISA